MSRLQHLKALMNELSVDAYYITHLPNIRYLSGFSGSAANILLTKNTNFFITDFRYKDQSAKEVSGFEILINYDSLSELKNILGQNSFGKVAFESTHLIYDNFQSFKNAVNGIDFLPLKNKIEEFTASKTQGEIDRMKKAIEITDKTFGKILEMLKPGISELDVSAEITYTQKKLGAEKDAFDPIVASGLRSSLPHGIASQKKIESGDAVTLDFGCVYQGFCSDMTRTVFVGNPSDELNKIYRVVFDAQRMAVETARADMSSKKLDAVARDFIKENGYGNYFGHGLGHGLGIEVHELPGLNQRTDNVLKKDSVVTIEPGIYIDSLGGVRIEDDVLLHESGCTALNQSPKELIIL